MTYPFGAYICVMNIDVDTGSTRSVASMRSTIAGTRIKPDDHRGPGAWRLTEAFAIAMGQGNPLRRRGKRRDRFVHGLFNAHCC